MQLFESSLEDLYRNAVDAFPYTRKRQHSTHPVVITEMHWTPFVGMKTLFIKGLAQSGETGKEYNPIILFKRVNFDEDAIRITASDGLKYRFSPLSMESVDVSVRCNCSDFKYRFNYYNHLDKALYGSKTAKYESKGIGPPANPKGLPGMCKHLMKMVKALKESGIFTEASIRMLDD